MNGNWVRGNSQAAVLKWIFNTSARADKMMLVQCSGSVGQEVNNA